MKIPGWLKKVLDEGYIIPISTAVSVTSIGWLLYEVYATINTLKTIGQVQIRSPHQKYIHINDAITKGQVLGRQGFLEPRFGGWLGASRRRLLWRLVELAQSGEPSIHAMAVLKLASLTHIAESEALQVAQACDADTAVALARCRGVRRDFFLSPPYKSSSHQDLIEGVRDILYKLNQESNHLCVKYFLTKAFPDFEKQSNYLLDEELMLTEPWTILTSQDNLLPLSVQALDHHISTVNHHETFLVELGGLPMMMAIHQQLPDNATVSKMLCRIMTRISSHVEFLPEVYKSGWVGVLSEWLDGPDKPLSLLAGHCLANLDRDHTTSYNTRCSYGRHVVPLHPSHRSAAAPPSVDVVFVHGLLGGVLSTWRQRQRYQPPTTSILGLQKEELVSVGVRWRSSDEHTQEYLHAMSELQQAEWSNLGSDYEFVLSDFPVNSNDESDPQYSLHGAGKPTITRPEAGITTAYNSTESWPLRTFHNSGDPKVRQFGSDQSYTLCWPMDWLPEDCPSIRVLGIDYESRLSEWFPTCTEKLRVKTLEERSAIVLEELKRCGIGKRPTVWVAHSMGGLLVKKMLTEALGSCDPQSRRIAHNSRAVVFLSTPHLGCPLAKLNDILNYLLWPSTEVEELRQNSDVLNELHESFHNFLKQINVKILTFAEAKTTRVNLGLDIHIVPPEFSLFDVGDRFEMPCDHVCVAKPCNRLSFIYQTVLNLIKTVKNETLDQNCNESSSKATSEETPELQHNCI